MPPEIRILGLGAHVPGDVVSNERLAERLGWDAVDLATETGIDGRHFAANGQGPSDLALVATEAALEQARTAADEIGLILFATATPDVTFPGSACFLQDKMGAPTVGSLDLRGQSAGFIAGLDLAAGFCGEEAPDGTIDSRYERVLLAAGEVFASGLDFSPGGREVAARLGDGAAVAVVGRGEKGPRFLGARWYTDGALVEKFWTEAPHSSQMPLRIMHEDIDAGRHFPKADFAALREVARERLLAVSREVAELAAFDARDASRVLIDYVEPHIARAVSEELGVAEERLVIPTRSFGHVMAGGLGIALSAELPKLNSGDKVLLAAAGSGFTWGAAALEVD